MTNLGNGWVLFGIRSSLIPLFVADVLGRTAFWVGIGFLVGSLTQAAALWPAGRIVDQVGRKPAMVGGSLLGVASMALLIGIQTLPGFLVAMALYGIAAAFLGVAPAAVVGDVVEGRGSGRRDVPDGGRRRAQSRGRCWPDGSPTRSASRRPWAPGDRHRGRRRARSPDARDSTDQGLGWEYRLSRARRIRSVKFAWLCSHESHQPEDLVRQAVLAEEAGFDVVTGADHFHPWVDDRSAASFVWTWFGAVAQARRGSSSPPASPRRCSAITRH